MRLSPPLAGLGELQAAMTRLILIRHGETDYASQGRYCGFSDPSLNEKGVRQSEKLAIRLKETRVDKIYSSDIKRAYESAKIIFNPSTTLRVNGERSRTIKNPSIEKLESFREIDFGHFEGLTHQEVMDKYPVVYQNWLNNPCDVNIPGGESLKDLAKRVRNSLREILSLNTGLTIAICAHAGPIRVILSDAQGLGLDKIWQVKVDCASLSRVEFINGKAKVISVNDIGHLNG